MNQDYSCAPRSIPVSFLTLLIAASILFFDQLTKWAVFLYLPTIHSEPYVYPYGGIPVFKDILGIEFSLNHMTNSGAAWGIFGNHQFPLVILRIFLILGLCVYLFCYNREKSRRLPLMLIIAGAIGNVCDYFIYGHVIDMFHFTMGRFDFPIFNVADAAISVGIGWLFVLSFLKK